MDKVQIHKNGQQVEIEGSSLPSPAAGVKGTIKKLNGIANPAFTQEVIDELTSRSVIDAYNGTTYDAIMKGRKLISIMKEAGMMENNRFSVTYEGNLGNKYVSNLPYDIGEYEVGENVDLLFGWRTDKYEEFSYPQPEDSYSHEFLGWSTDPEAIEPEFTENDTNTITMPNHDVTLYAIWREKLYYLRYHHSDCSTGEKPEDTVLHYGDTVSIQYEPAPTYNGNYEDRYFVGWTGMSDFEEYFENQNRPSWVYSMMVQYKAGVNTDFNYYASSDIDLYPAFLPKYTATYSLGNDASGSVPDPVSVIHGSSFIPNFLVFPTCVSDPSKVFAGWKTEYIENGMMRKVLFYINTNYMMTLYQEYGNQGYTIQRPQPMGMSWSGGISLPCNITLTPCFITDPSGSSSGGSGSSSGDSNSYGKWTFDFSNMDKSALNEIEIILTEYTDADYENPTTITLFGMSSSQSKTIEVNTNSEYFITVFGIGSVPDSDAASGLTAYFSGFYSNGANGSYKGELLDISDDEWNAEYNIIALDDIDVWTFSKKDYGTITFSYKSVILEGDKK